MSNYLNDCPLSRDLKHLSLPNSAVTQADINNFCELRELDVVEDNKRTIHLDDSTVVDSWSDVVIPRHCLQIGIKELSLIHFNYIIVGYLVNK
jgi:hypothetical protein